MQLSRDLASVLPFVGAPPLHCRCLRTQKSAADLQAWLHVPRRRKDLSGTLWARAASMGVHSWLERRQFGLAEDVYAAGWFILFMVFCPLCPPGSADLFTLRVRGWGDEGGGGKGGGLEGIASVLFAAPDTPQSNAGKRQHAQHPSPLFLQLDGTEPQFKPPFKMYHYHRLLLQRLFESTFLLDLGAAREYCEADEDWQLATSLLAADGGAGWDLLREVLQPDWQLRPPVAACLKHPFLQ